MKPNIELLKKLRNRFARMRHPKHLRMEQIAIKTDCGAAMCMIGHTLVLAGYKMKLDPSPDSEHIGTAAHSDYIFISPSGKQPYDLVEVAGKLLGIDDDTQRSLFENFSIKTPKQAVKKLDKLIAKLAA